MSCNISHASRLINEQEGVSEKDSDGNSDLDGTIEDAEYRLSAEVELSYALSDEVARHAGKKCHRRYASDPLRFLRFPYLTRPLSLVHDVEVTLSGRADQGLSQIMKDRGHPRS